MANIIYVPKDTRFSDISGAAVDAFGSVLDARKRKEEEELLRQIRESKDREEALEKLAEINDLELFQMGTAQIEAKFPEEQFERMEVFGEDGTRTFILDNPKKPTTPEQLREEGLYLSPPRPFFANRGEGEAQFIGRARTFAEAREMAKEKGIDPGTVVDQDVLNTQLQIDELGARFEGLDLQRENIRQQTRDVSDRLQKAEEFLIRKGIPFDPQTPEGQELRARAANVVDNAESTTKLYQDFFRKQFGADTFAFFSEDAKSDFISGAPIIEDALFQNMEPNEALSLATTKNAFDIATADSEDLTEKTSNMNTRANAISLFERQVGSTPENFEAALNTYTKADIYQIVGETNPEALPALERILDEPSDEFLTEEDWVKLIEPFDPRRPDTMFQLYDNPLGQNPNSLGFIINVGGRILPYGG